jgi:hypothetical protein
VILTSGGNANTAISPAAEIWTASEGTVGCWTTREVVGVRKPERLPKLAKGLQRQSLAQEKALGRASRRRVPIRVHLTYNGLK